MLLVWLIFGFIVGYVATALHPGEENLGFFATVGIGVAGTFIGGLIHSMLRGSFSLHPAGLIWSIVGGVIFCYLYSYYKNLPK